MNGFEIYNEMEDDLQAIYRSRLLTEILLSLNDTSKKLSQ
ncbi:ArsR family transcriptional regulator, partial [Methanosarcina sp. MSH10X1]